MHTSVHIVYATYVLSLYLQMWRSSENLTLHQTNKKHRKSAFNNTFFTKIKYSYKATCLLTHPYVYLNMYEVRKKAP
jgi:hypothetical protein